MSGHSAIGPCLKEEIKKSDSDKYWWCGGGKQQTRHHLFAECRVCAPQTRRMWKVVGKACRWRHPKAPSVRQLWKDKATEAVWAFLGTQGSNVW